MKTVWTTYTKYVDLETGEEISAMTAINEYDILKRDKHARQTKIYDRNRKFCGYKIITEWTAQCQRKRCQQLSLGL